jgi:hypothetical protein
VSPTRTDLDRGRQISTEVDRSLERVESAQVEQLARARHAVAAVAVAVALALASCLLPCLLAPASWAPLRHPDPEFLTSSCCQAKQQAACALRLLCRACVVLLAYWLLMQYKRDLRGNRVKARGQGAITLNQAVSSKQQARRRAGVGSYSGMLVLRLVVVVVRGRVVVRRPWGAGRIAALLRMHAQRAARRNSSGYGALTCFYPSSLQEDPAYECPLPLLFVACVLPLYLLL